MLKRSLVALLVAGLVTNVVAQNPKPITTCIKDLTVIYNNENLVKDVSIRRVYTLCPKTVFSPGVANPKTGQIEGGQTPLAVRANCLVKCGANGNSANSCVIDGTGTFGIFQVPYNLFIDRPKGSVNVVFQGITVDFFVQAGQIPVLAAAFFGDVTFLDCVFSNNSADPVFVLSDFAIGGGIARSATIDSSPDSATSPPPGFVWAMNRTTDEDRRRLIDNHAHDDKEGSDIEASGIRSRRGLRATDLPSNDENDVVTEGNRILQTSSTGFTISFEDCLFVGNDPVRNARSQGGLSLIRFAGTDVKSDEKNLERYGNIDARIIRTKFRDNTFNFNNDVAAYRSLIDFFSKGRLTLRQNCFVKSPVKNYGVITVQTGPEAIENDRNFVDTVQTALKCDFVAFLNQQYNQVGCGPPANSATCRADTPTQAPTKAPGTGGFCFPGDATCEVQGQGQVRMSDIKLGDKVMVQGGKYETVYSFGHLARQVEATYLQFVTTGLVLEISKDHMVFVEGGRSVPASIVKVGEKLLLTNGNVETVKAIRSVRKQGAYAPFTASGTVAVNGVVASSFVAFQDSETLKIGDIDTTLSFQFLARTFETPHRMWCQYVSACTEEKYTVEGVSLWVDLPHKLALWFLEQDPVVIAIVGVPLIVGFGCMAYPVAAFMTFAAILGVIGRPLLLRKSI